MDLLHTFDILYILPNSAQVHTTTTSRVFFWIFFIGSFNKSDISLPPFDYCFKTCLLKRILPLPNPKPVPILRASSKILFMHHFLFYISRRPRGRPPGKKAVKSAEFIDDQAEDM